MKILGTPHFVAGWGHWDVWIDLFTIHEKPSDLVLKMRVEESSNCYRFDVQSVYVP